MDQMPFSTEVVSDIAGLYGFDTSAIGKTIQGQPVLAISPFYLCMLQGYSMTRSEDLRTVEQLADPPRMTSLETDVGELGLLEDRRLMAPDISYLSFEQSYDDAALIGLAALARLASKDLSQENLRKRRSIGRAGLRFVRAAVAVGVHRNVAIIERGLPDTSMMDGLPDDPELASQLARVIDKERKQTREDHANFVRQASARQVHALPLLPYLTRHYRNQVSRMISA